MLEDWHRCSCWTVGKSIQVRATPLGVEPCMWPCAPSYVLILMNIGSPGFDTHEDGMTALSFLLSRYLDLSKH